jgi:hypothetical protein
VWLGDRGSRVYLFILRDPRPFGTNQPKHWWRLQREYDALVKREFGKYPIYVLSNDAELKLTVSKAIAESHG